MYYPNTRWTWAFLLVVAFQAIIGIALEAWVFATFESSINRDQIKKSFQKDPSQQNKLFLSNETPESKSIPTYLSVFMFGFIYQLLLVWDALRLKNTIQVIGLVFYNIGILIYAAIQIDQIRTTTNTLLDSNFFKPDHRGFWDEIKGELKALPVVIAVGTIAMAFIAWKLYDEFAWTIYKHISADLRMKKRYLTYQIYIALLKFDFFFFLAFTIQFLIIINGTQIPELVLTIVAIPVTILLLVLAGYWVRRETLVGMCVIIFVFLIGTAYFMFKLVRMYAADDARKEQYKPARTMLTTFAIITLLLIVTTTIISIICMTNFNKGLKKHLGKATTESDTTVYESEMPDYKQPNANRMTID